MMTSPKPLTLLATAAIAIAALTGCASTPPEAVPAETTTVDDTGNPNGEAMDTLGQEELDAMSTAQQMVQNAPLALVLPLAQHSLGGRTLEIVDTKGAQVQQNAENYLVSSVVNDGSVVRVNASRIAWEQVSQLEDSTRSQLQVSPSDTLVVVDTAGNPVDPYALNYVVLDGAYDAGTTTFTVEPNREYTKGE